MTGRNPGVRATLLAGGFGERMGPLGMLWPKPLIPYGGRCRLIDFSIANARRSGLSEVHVLLYHQREVLAEVLIRDWEGRQGYAVHFGYMDAAVHTPRKELSAPLNKKKKKQGTADAYLTHRAFIDDPVHDDVLIMHADHVYAYDHTGLITAHRAHSADLTIGYQRIERRYVPLFGMVEVDAHQRVTRLVEKPNRPITDTVFTAFCVFRRSALYGWIDRLRNGRWQHDLSRDVIPAMIDGGARVLGYPVTTYWEDIGTVDRYWQAHVRLATDPASPGARAVAATPATLLTDRRCADVVLGDRVTHSVVFPEASVAAEARVIRSVVLPGARVTADQVLEDAIALPGGAILRMEGGP